MPHVLWTDEHFRKDDIFDTKIFCEPNRRAVDAAGPVQKKVEGLLNKIRLVMNFEHKRDYDEYVRMIAAEESVEPFRPLPERMCSISAVPWPTDMGYNPVDGARYCYYIRPKGPGESTWALVAEDWVDLLVDRWDKIGGTEEADRLAEKYWSGVPRFYGPGTSNLLIQGKVVVEGECPAEETGFRPEPIYPPRLRPTSRWSERLKKERGRIGMVRP